MGFVETLKRWASEFATRAPHQRMSRALVKTLVYRILMIVITIVVAFYYTRDAGEALGIGLVSNVIKTGTYYGYERLWDRISWGMSSPNP